MRIVGAVLFLVISLLGSCGTDSTSPGGGAQGVDAAVAIDAATQAGDTDAATPAGDAAVAADAAAPGPDLVVQGMSTCVGPQNAALAQVTLPPHYCAWTWATGLSQARGITVDPQGNVLVVARGNAQVVALWDDDRDGLSGPNERIVVAAAAQLNHGIALHKGWLYASSATTVYRWAYQPRRNLGAGAAVVTGLPGGGHVTRTLLFDQQDYLYVSVGSAGNLDADSRRARIIRYKLADLEMGPRSFGQGELFADGERNEVGLALDSRGRVWGVENGSDNLMRNDIGGDIHGDNPGEELNLFADPGRFYGYPYCWSEFKLPQQFAKGPGTQWAYPGTINDGTHTDAWCRDPKNVVPPVLTMQGHAAPLDILFYPGNSFPADTVGDALITFHGSWNRNPTTGRMVVRVPFGANGMPGGDPIPLLQYSGGNDISNFRHRPVGLAVSPQGLLYVTDDEANAVLAIGYDGT